MPAEPLSLVRDILLSPATAPAPATKREPGVAPRADPAPASRDTLELGASPGALRLGASRRFVGATAEARGRALIAKTSRLDDVTALRLQSGSATLLVCLADVAHDRGEAALLARAVDALLAGVERLAHPALAGAVRDAVSARQARWQLTPTQAARLTATSDPRLPRALDWGRLLARGGDVVQIRQYVHEDHWDIFAAPYRQRGFSELSLGSGETLFEKRVTDPTGAHPPLAVRIRASRIWPARSPHASKLSLAELADPAWPIVVYTGHSDYSSNVLHALCDGPSGPCEDKLSFVWQCRGHYVIPHVTQRYPSLHFATTRASPLAANLPALIGGLLDMIARRGDYAAWKGLGDHADELLLPDDPRGLRHRDADHNGKLDATTDDAPLFEVHPSDDGGVIDLTPQPAGAVSPKDGLEVTAAVAAANRFLRYHLENADHASRLPARYADALVPDGFVAMASDPEPADRSSGAGAQPRRLRERRLRRRRHPRRARRRRRL